MAVLVNGLSSYTLPGTLPEPVWEDTAIAYIPMCYFLNAIVIGLLMPFVYSEMLDDFPPH